MYEEHADEEGSQIVFQLEYRIKRMVARRWKGSALGLPPSGKGRNVGEQATSFET